MMHRAAGLWIHPAQVFLTHTPLKQNPGLNSKPQNTKLPYPKPVYRKSRNLGPLNRKTAVRPKPLNPAPSLRQNASSAKRVVAKLMGTRPPSGIKLVTAWKFGRDTPKFGKPDLARSSFTVSLSSRRRKCGAELYGLRFRGCWFEVQPQGPQAPNPTPLNPKS